MKKMKKLLMVCLICVGTITMNAQNVGISATGIVPSGDAGLDVNFTDKGVLIPRVSLSSLTTYNPPITGGGPTTSMLIYNTNTTIGAGYYYWDGSKWVKLLVTGSPSDAWLTLGNAGTTPGTHFLGTTDNVDLVFKTNNTERMRITSAGNVGIGTTTPIERLHVANGNVRVGEINPTNTGTFPGYGRFLYFSGGPAGSTWDSDNSDPLWIGRYNVGSDATELRINIGDNPTGGDAFVVGVSSFGWNPVFYVGSNGNVGIGTTTPANKLGVVGGNISWGNASEVSLLQNDQGGSIELGGQNGLANPIASGSPYIDFHYGTGTSQDFNARIINGANNRLDFVTNSAGAVMSINGGNVGIGTTAPAQKLDVSGNVQFSGALMPGGNAGTTGQVLVSQGAGTAPQWKPLLKEVPSGNTNFKICFGQSNAWYDCNGSNGCSYNDGIIIDIDMSGCAFTNPPYVFTSLKGNSNHWETTGATSIYLLTSTSFRVYIYRGFNTSLNVSFASANGYTLMWMAIGN